MKKSLFSFPLVAAFCVFTLILIGCPDATDNGEDSDVPLASLVNTVWAGETPRVGDWLTMSFRAENKIVMSFIIDNSSSEWTFTYDPSNKTGTIVTGSDWSPAPEGFTISTDAKTITVPNYGGHGGDKQFKRLRQADLTLDANPFTPGTLDTNLVGSVWGGETPRSGDWLTLAFKAESELFSAFAIDNSKNEWTFTYNATGKSGTISTGSSWSPAPGGFAISNDGQKLTIPNYGGHGAEKSFSRFR
jgi:hypothetical protein